MRVVRVRDTIESPSVIPDTIPQPQPGPRELLIRVLAAGITLSELSWYTTTHTDTGDARIGAVPAHEFSGVVAAIGEEVGSLETGGKVFGMNGWYSNGAMADYCIAPFFAVAPKPCHLTYAEAASIPISALTAWQGLFDHAKLKPAETVLVHGGAGAVGAFVIQLARLHGARVIATASGRNCDFVLSLGAEQVIDYRKSKFEECVTELDVVFDTVGGETLARSWSVLKPSGRMVTVAASAEAATDPRVQRAFFIVEPNQKQLYEVGRLLDEGKLRPVVDSVVPMSQAPAVFAGMVMRKGRGKMVVTNPDLE